MNTCTQKLKSIDDNFLDSLSKYLLPSLLITQEGEIYFINDYALEFLNKKPVKKLSDLNNLKIIAVKNFQKINAILTSLNNFEFPEIINEELLFLPTKFYNCDGEKLFLLILDPSGQITDYSVRPNKNNKCLGQKYFKNLGNNFNKKVRAGYSLVNTSVSTKSEQTVVRKLLPQRLPKVPPLSFSFLYEPCSCFGGDLFNIQEMTKNRLAIYIADVSGHGLLSTILAMLFKNLIDKYMVKFESPAEILKTVNIVISEIFQMEDFVSTFFAILSLENFQLTYSNAGHPAPLLYSASKQSIMELDTDGFFLGVFPLC